MRAAVTVLSSRTTLPGSIFSCRALTSSVRLIASKVSARMALIVGDRRLYRVVCLGVVPRVPSIGHEPLDRDIGDEHRNLTTGLGKGKRCGAESPAMRGRATNPGYAVTG